MSVSESNQKLILSVLVEVEKLENQLRERGSKYPNGYFVGYVSACIAFRGVLQRELDKLQATEIKEYFESYGVK